MDAETIEKYFELQEMVQYDLKDDEIVILHQYTKQLLAARRPVSEQIASKTYIGIFSSASSDDQEQD